MAFNFEKVIPLFVSKYGSPSEFKGTREEYMTLLFAFADGWGARDTARNSAKMGRPKGKRSLPKGKKADK